MPMQALLLITAASHRHILSKVNLSLISLIKEDMEETQVRPRRSRRLAYRPNYAENEEMFEDLDDRSDVASTYQESEQWNRSAIIQDKDSGTGNVYLRCII
jgi:hypothetical protein